MNSKEKLRLASLVLGKTREFGAQLVGLADLEALKMEPSARVLPLVAEGVYQPPVSPYGLKPGEVKWPAGGKSVLVFAVPHPKQQPELDWWYGQINPPGNQILKDIADKVKDWLNEHYPTVEAHPLAYHVERGGVFLKEAARLAGLGCIGRNNLLVSGEFGPRIRLRAMILSEKLPPTGPTSFDPCAVCEAPCLKVCPNGAFDRQILTPEATGEKLLPARVGDYSRDKCAEIMLANEAEAEKKLVPDIADEPVEIIKYCRNCEFSCPLGGQA